MLSKIVIKCQSRDIGENTYAFAAAFRGVLMEQLDTDYAAQIHEQGLHPYSYSIVPAKLREVEGETSFLWTVNTLSEEACSRIIEPLCDEAFKEFHLKRLGRDFSITEKHFERMPASDLAKDFYKNDAARKVRIEFLTPTAFGSSGTYVFIPDLTFVFRSLMQKYTSSAESDAAVDVEMLNAVIENTHLTGYRLRSVRFAVDNIKIPGFIGYIDIKVNGAQTLANYVNLILRFGEYSGVGIKTSMGMGAIAVTAQATDTAKKGMVDSADES